MKTTRFNLVKFDHMVTEQQFNGINDDWFEAMEAEENKIAEKAH